ncbi:hypothetical protein HY772_02125 [Candidatus Woesearchaeota archaeon]|nr:hypothetical protein [Candidatus Woesearchaeota archaeon]
MRVVGFDGKRIRRQDGFQALLGVGVTLTDYPRFTKEYNAIFERLFKKHGLERLKPIYKASELQGIFHGLGTEVIEEVATSLLSQINFIDIYYMHFLDPAWNASPRKQSIACFYKEKIKYLSPAKFIDLVEGKFPALCCY